MDQWWLKEFNDDKSRSQKKRPLRKNSKYMILLVAILLTGFVITSSLSYLVTKNYVKYNEISETLPLISDNIFSAIQAEFLRPIDVSSLMAHDTFLINWVQSGEKDLSEITEYLGTIRQKYGFTTSFYVSDITENYYYYNGILKKISPEDSHDTWYYKFRDLNKPYDLDVDTDEAANGKLTIFINHRLESLDGIYLGAAGVGLELSNVGERLATYQERFNHNIFFIDSDGLIQIHSDQSLVENRNIKDMEGIAEISDSILRTGEDAGIFNYEDQSGKKVLSVRYFPEFDWFLIVENNEDTSLLQAKLSLWQNIFIGFVVTAIISGLILWVLNTYNKHLEYLAAHDELTGLYNRRSFQQLMEREINISKRYKQPLSLLMIDIDDFKKVNDTYGHIIGDEILKLITHNIFNSFRDIDIVARWGGEEICVLLVNTDKTGAYAAALRVQEEIDKIYFQQEKSPIHLTVSIGVASIDLDNPNGQNLILQADKAMYQSKAAGKNLVSSL